MKCLIILAFLLNAMAAKASAQQLDEAVLTTLIERGQVEIEGFVVTAAVSLEEQKIRLRDVEVHGPDGDGIMAAKLVRARRVSDLFAIVDLFRPEPCKAWRSRQAEHLQVEGLSFLADTDSMPRRGANRERVDVISLEGTLDQRQCEQSASFTFNGITFSGAGREKLFISTIKLNTRRSGRDGRVIDLAVDSEGINLWAPATESSFNLSRFAVSIAGDFSESGTIAQLSSLDLGSLLAIAAQETLTFALAVEGLEVDVGAFLPGDIIRSAGLENINDLTGDAELALTLVNGAVNAKVDIDIVQLLDAEFELLAQVGDRPTLPEFIVNALPVPDAVLGISVARFGIDYKDLGLNGVLDAAGQPTPERLVLAFDEKIVAGFADRLPGALANDVRQASTSLARLFSHGGRIVMKPDNPVGLVDIVSRGLAGPDPLEAILGIEAVIGEE